MRPEQLCVTVVNVMGSDAGWCLRMKVELIVRGFCLAGGDAAIGGVTGKDGEYLCRLVQVPTLDVISLIIQGALGTQTTTPNPLIKEPLLLFSVGLKYLN